MLVILLGCSDSTPDPSTTSSVQLPTGSWILVDGAPTVSGHPTSLVFVYDNGEAIRGSAPCNDYGSEVDIDTSTMSVTGISSTAEDCGGTQGAAETAYLRVLGEIATWRYVQGSLELSGPSGTLIFEPAQ